MNFELMANSFPLLLAGAAITVEITAMSVTFGLLIGCMIGIARLCSIKPLRYFANVYVDFIRGTPLLVQIFLVYFALPN
ncbi:MAG: ABC transporter permease subunit, partial [Phascolarctobacterium succinatutens]|nr:ABC transporter permease subunit [Phascolarctobacterium succinatutens]